MGYRVRNKRKMKKSQHSPTKKNLGEKMKREEKMSVKIAVNQSEKAEKMKQASFK
jgi:hypothetical protein